MPGAEGVWFNRSKEWAARNRRQEYGTYDFATRYSIRFAQLPAFRHLTPEEYQDRIAGLIREIEEEGERKRDGDPVAGVEKILSQNPLEPPTRQTKRSPKPPWGGHHPGGRLARARPGPAATRRRTPAACSRRVACANVDAVLAEGSLLGGARRLRRRGCQRASASTAALSAPAWLRKTS